MERTYFKEYLQKEIILFPCPFSDRTNSKIRPAIIISNNNYNKENEDVMVAPLTSKMQTKYSVKITNENIGAGQIAKTSEIRVDKITQIHKSLILTQIGIVEEKIMQEIRKKFIDLITNK